MPAPPRRPTPLRAAAAALAVLLLGGPLPAYLVRRTSGGEDIRWNTGAAAPNLAGGRVTFYVDEASAVDVTGPEFAAAVRAAVASWEDPAVSSLGFAEDPARPASQKSGSDRVNRLGFSAGVLPPFAFASTFATIQGNRLTDVDVVFNPDMTWSVETPGNPARADVQSVAAHEWGHGIGLDHVPLVRSTMFFSASFGQISLRTLEIDDLAGAARSYPAEGLDAGRGRIRGAVAVAGTSDDRGIQVSAVDFVSGLPVASSITGPDGEYEILGLPPGVYRLLASPLGTDTVARGAYSPYWDSSATRVLPAVRGQDGAADGSTGAVVLAAGGILEGVDLAVAAATAPGEPDNSTGSARPSALGRSVAGRIENSSDRDLVSFAGVQGRTVSIFVHAGQIGSGLDPRLYLRAPNGTVLAVSADIADDDLEVSGADTDARILDFVLPATGTYFAEVEPEQSVDPQRPEDFFYVLTMLEGGIGEASPHASTLVAVPPVVPADGASESVVTFRPLTLQATPPAAGAAVSFALAADGDPDGVPSAAEDHGDGTWSIAVKAPASPGSDVVLASVDGSVVSSATLTWRGPADFAATGFAATPRRIRAGGPGTSLLVLVPRDAGGVPLGAGRGAVLSLAGDPSSTLGATEDAGDGTYSAVLEPGAGDEDLEVRASVDGVPLDGSWFAGVGFPLGPVVADAVADLGEALQADPPPPAKAAGPLAKALARLGPASDPDPLEAVTAVAGALRSLEAAGRKGWDADATSRELAEAVREAARVALDGASPLADTGAEDSLLRRASAAFARGDLLLDGGRAAAAAARHRTALRLALKVQ